MNGRDGSNKPLRAVIWCAVSSQAQAAEDKISLEFQEREARAWCEANNAEVTQVLVVPGHSRREADIITLLEDYAKNNIYVYHQLRDLWQSRAFDLFVAYSFDRIGRSQTLIAWVAENIILHGMEIYLLADGGLVTRRDFRYRLGIAGITAAAPIDHLIEKSREAKIELTKRGLPTGPHIPLSHRHVRDPQTGRTERLELNPDTQQFMYDFAEVLLMGIAWGCMGQALYDFYGYTDKTGKPYSSNTLYSLLHTPAVWGHMAQGYTASSKVRTSRDHGVWVFDEHENPPEGVQVVRNVIPPVYTGEFAERVRAEMRRRKAIRGRNTPYRTYRFSGLCICGVCGSSMSARVKEGRVLGLRCPTPDRQRQQPDRYVQRCNQGKMTPHAYLQDIFSKLLEQIVHALPIDIFETPTPIDRTGEELARVAHEIQQAHRQIENIIREQSLAPANVQTIYRQQVQRMSERLAGLQKQHDLLQQRHAAEALHIERAATTIEELRQMSLHYFWQLPDREIHQYLSRILGSRKLVLVDRRATSLVLRA